MHSFTTQARPAVVCEHCGRRPGPDEPWQLTWPTSRARAETVRLCPACARASARDIEAKLDIGRW